MLKKRTTVSIITSLVIVTGFFVADMKSTQLAKVDVKENISVSRSLQNDNLNAQNIYEQDKPLNYELKNNVEFLERKEKEKEMAIKKEELKKQQEQLEKEAKEEKIKQLEERKEKVIMSVVNGEYGDGKARETRLINEGYNFNEIQAAVSLYLENQAKLEEIKVAKLERNQYETPSRGGTSLQSANVPLNSTNKGKFKAMEATAYSIAEPGMGKITANGTDLRVNSRVIAVDPKIIPLGSKVEIEGYGIYTAADTGGAIKGNRIDIHFNSVQECINFGRRNIQIRVL